MFEDLVYKLEVDGSGASIHTINGFKLHVKACERHPDDQVRYFIVKNFIEEALRTRRFAQLLNGLDHRYKWWD